MATMQTVLDAFRASRMGAVINVSDLLVQEMTDEETARLKKIADAWQAYGGKLEKPLKSTQSDPQGRDNILLNFGAPIVDTGISFLTGKGVQFEIDGKADGDADQWLKQCLATNKFPTKLHLLAMNGGVCGDVFVKMLDKAPGRPFPRLVVLDPACVDAVWAPDDMDHILQYKIQWNGIDPTTKRAVAFRQLISEDAGGLSWTLQDQTCADGSQTWTNTGPARPWRYPWAPVFHCQNLPMPNCYYGLSDLEEHVVSVNTSINFVVSNMARIIRMHAHPKTWGRGFNAKELQIGVDTTIILNSKDAELKNLELMSDLGSSLELSKRLKEVLHEITRVPEVATGKVDNIGALSGVALQILYQSILQKTDTKRLLYGDMLTDLATRLLELGGEGWHGVVVKWTDALPTDQAAQAQTLEADQRMGIVSKDTLASKRGYDFSAEKGKIAEEGQDLGDNLLNAFDKGQTGEQA